MFLEEYLSIADARRYLKASESERIKEWFEKVPQLIEDQVEEKQADHVIVNNGVTLKSNGAIVKSSSKYEKDLNLMTLDQYYKLTEDKTLADRFKATKPIIDIQIDSGMHLCKLVYSISNSKLRSLFDLTLQTPSITKIVAIFFFSILR